MKLLLASCKASAHPRVCGENRCLADRLGSQVGSSPRVRGKLNDVEVDIVGSGLIPACAGKTGVALALVPLPRAHPRVCGENGGQRGLRGVPPGSSPRVRGKP